MQLIQMQEYERDLWDQYAMLFSHVHPLNAFGWGKIREIDGWEPKYYVVKDGDTIKGMIMVLKKDIPLTSYSIWYAPKSPLFAGQDLETLKIILRHVKEEGKNKNAIFLRIDPNLQEDVFSKGEDPFEEGGFIHLSHRWSFWNSPRDVYRIDLKKFASTEELFKTFDRDTRRCIRKAEKDGVSILASEKISDLRAFYDIFHQFSVDKGFMCRSYQYQQALWKEYVANGNGQLFLAIYKGNIIGGIVCLSFGKKCLAMHMGTLPQYSKLHATYAFVWASIRWAKEKGCHWYSFRGIGTTPTQESFKRKFKPAAIALVGYYDLPFRPFLYKVFNFGEFELLPRIWRALMVLRRGYSFVVRKLS